MKLCFEGEMSLCIFVGLKAVVLIACWPNGEILYNIVYFWDMRKQTAQEHRLGNVKMFRKGASVSSPTWVQGISKWSRVA